MVSSRERVFSCPLGSFGILYDLPLSLDTLDPTRRPLARLLLLQWASVRSEAPDVAGPWFHCFAGH